MSPSQELVAELRVFRAIIEERGTGDSSGFDRSVRTAAVSSVK